MIPPLSDGVWSKLIKGTAEYQFKIAAASLLVFTLRSQYKRDPSRFPALVEEARKFFLKYENILVEDVQRLAR
jgi:hypothetical protein